MLHLSLYPLPMITYTHDASAALLSEEEIVYAYEEEKIARLPHAIAAVPERSAILGMKYLHLLPDDIECLTVASMESCWLRPDYLDRVAFVRDLLTLKTCVPVTCVPHHLAHSALSVLTSPFEECLFLTIDAGGDGRMGHWGIFRDGSFNEIESFVLSPGIFYGYVTSLAGFPFFEEGKVMGLSAYGKVNERLWKWFGNKFWIRANSAEMEVAPDIRLSWQSKLTPSDFDADRPRRHKYYRLGVRFHDDSEAQWLNEVSALDIAATGQKYFQRLIVQAVRNIVERSGLRQIAVSGGAFQNVLVNAELRSIEGLDVHIPVAPHDSGLALGAGLLSAFQSSGRRNMQSLSPYLGPSYQPHEVKEALDKYSLSYSVPENLNAVVVEELVAGRIVGWFHGRAEFGARALGARSVLADPRCSDSRTRLNQGLKRRDWYMPYAPSILEERGRDYLNDMGTSPYMNISFQVLPNKRGFIESAVHVDGSCRAHTVNRTQNERFYSLVKDFFAATGVPLLLNTSFNRHGVPIVATPKQAIDHLLEGNIDSLAIEGFFVRGQARRSEVKVLSDTECLKYENMSFVARLVSSGNVDRAREYASECCCDVEVEAEGLRLKGRWVWKIGEHFPGLANWARLRED